MTIERDTLTCKDAGGGQELVDAVGEAAPLAAPAAAGAPGLPAVRARIVPEHSGAPIVLFRRC
jgi:hypothetical protein